MIRRRPYTVIGLARLPCFRCGGKPSIHQWQLCADGRAYRPLCEKCDVLLNALVLRWMRVKNWRAVMKRYRP